MPSVQTLPMAGSTTPLNGLGGGAGLDSLGSYSALQQYSGEPRIETRRVLGLVVIG